MISLPIREQIVIRKTFKPFIRNTLPFTGEYFFLIL
nr:MAG TPA: hypothetical protein [Bacteriophage sp.]